MTARDEYQSRLESYNRQVNSLERKIIWISRLRLFIFFVTVALTGLLYNHYGIAAYGVVPFGLLFFIIAVIRHKQLDNGKAELEVLASINQTGLNRIAGDWRLFKDRGAEFIDEDHPYTSDLDIFGEFSLFQHMNCSSSYLGRLKMQSTLSFNVRPIEAIEQYQQAIQELGPQLDWRQRLQACTLPLLETKDNPILLMNWARAEYSPPWRTWIYTVMGMPVLSGMALAVSWFFSVYAFIPLSLYLIQFIIFSFQAKYNHNAMKVFEAHYDTLNRYAAALTVIEQLPAQSDMLTSLKKTLVNKEHVSASKILSKLAALIYYADARFMPLAHFMLNTLFLWDARCVLGLKAWKNQHGGKLSAWLETVAEFEVLCAFSGLHFDHPAWVFPTVVDHGEPLVATDMGHPLIADHDRRGNDFSIEDLGAVMIVTGSNMSGKSTLLRTVGVNLVLAYAGAPVCARVFCCRKMEIFTSMRIRDELGNHISTFYGELLKIKKILNAIAECELPVMVLVDEIFRGTNSRDRHEGSVAVIKALSGAKTVSLISTHDLTLCELEKEYPRVKNVHFSEYFTENAMAFDYILKPGVSDTSNAVHLMKMIGLEVP